MALILFPLSIFGIIWGSLLYNVLPMLAIAILDGLWWSVIAIIILVKTIRLFKSEKLIESVKTIKKINESKSDLSYIKIPHQRKMLKEHEKGDKRMHSLNSENNRLSESNKINLKETWDKNPSLTEDKIMLNDELSLETNNQHLYTDESTITPRMIDKMKYLDENNKSESDENREFFKSIQNTVILNPGDQSNLAKNIEEMMYLQKMFKSKLNESSETHNELKVIQQAEGSHFGIKIFFVLLNAFLLFSNEIMRGESQDSFIGISQWSIGDWILLIIVSISAIAISATTVNYIISMFNKKMKAGYALIPSDINWNYTNSAYLLALSFVFGVIGGISNIGEGTPYAMLLIMLGKHPFVATSTGMFMSIVYSSAISCVYAIEGFFDDEYYLFLGAIAIIGSLIGMFLWNRIFDIVNRSSLLFFLLSINWLVIGICLTHQIINRKFQDGSVRNTITDFGSYWNKNS